MKLEPMPKLQLIPKLAITLIGIALMIVILWDYFKGGG